MTDIPNEKLPDLTEIFDLNRHKAVRNFVDRFEELAKQKEAVVDDVKQLAIEAKEAMFSPVEISAMKAIAGWKNGDKLLAAAVKLAALRRVSNATKVDLFSWADAHRDDA